MDSFNKIASKINSDYDIVELLKRNERGSVSVIRERKTGKRFVFRKFYGSGEVYKKLLNVSCKNLPEIIEAEEIGGSTAVIEEYIFGDTLFEILRAETFSKEETLKIAIQLCEAMEVLHSIGAVHRDIKPENIILRGSEAVLIDFDAARIVDPDKSTDTKILGTTGYASPEQYGLCQTDARSDIYSFGVVLNVMLTGEHPSTKLAEGVFGEIVQKCTMINPDMRYQSAAELKEVLIKSGEKKNSSKKGIFAGILAAMVVLGIAVGIPTIKENHQQQENAIIASGFCGAEEDGKNLEWKVDSNNVLTISGTGRMADYDTEGTDILVCPWKDYQNMLSGLVIEEGVESIGVDAFRYMKISGDELVLPKSLLEIGTMAFCANDFSGELILPEGLKTIGDNAFQAAGDFTFAYVPSTVLKIYDTPFRYCGLEEIIVEEENPFYCSYEGALFTRDMKEIIQFPENVTGTYSLPSSVEIIGDGAFEKSSLSEIIIDGNIKSVGGVAFQFYPGEVVFNGKVEEIKDWAFNTEDGMTKVYFFGGAPEKVSPKTDSKWGSFMGNVNIFYLEGTDGWESDSQGLWNGYKVTAIENKEDSEFIKIMDIGPATGKSKILPPDFYDYWEPEELITENIRIYAPGNIEKYINYKYAEDVLTFTIGKIPKEEWKKAVEEISSEEEIILSILVDAPSMDVTGFVKNHGNGPTYANLKRQIQNGTKMSFNSFDPSCDSNWSGLEIAAVIREDGKIIVAPIDRESTFYAVLYWQTESGENISRILPYKVKIGDDFTAVCIEDENYHKNYQEEELYDGWLSEYWEPVTNPERVAFRTIYSERNEIETSVFEEFGLSVNVFEKAGLIETSVMNLEKFNPKIMANAEVFVLPPDASARKAEESLTDWIDRVYKETEYVGFKVNATGIEAKNRYDYSEAAKIQNDIINAGFFYEINDKNTCCLNLLAMNFSKTKEGTLWYTVDNEGASVMIIDWYTESPEENPDAKPKKREYMAVNYESFSVMFK